MIELTPIEPDDPQPVYDYEVELAGIIFRVVLLWTDRDDSPDPRVGKWYLSLFDSDDTALLSGKRLGVDVPVLNRYRGAFPDGQVMLLDTESEGADPGFDDLGFRHRLVFIPSDKIEAPEPAETFTIV